MKKYIITLSILLLVSVCTNLASASGNPSDKYKKQVTYPSAPNYSIPNLSTAPQTSTRTQSGGNSTKAQLDSIAMQMLKAAENHQNIAPYQRKFLEKGVDSMCPPQIIAKRTPKCPPIKVTVNGRKLSGSKCALTCYEYQGKQYDVGYCK